MRTARWVARPYRSCPLSCRSRGSDDHHVKNALVIRFAQPIIPADRLRRPLNSNVGPREIDAMVARTKKTTVAREQLEDGIALLVSGRYISALTLLGAAEEIMARLIEESGGQHPLDEYWSGINDWNRSHGGNEVSKKFVYRYFNEPRNAVKHHTPGEASSIAIFKVAAAAMMARRATAAADILKLKYKNKAVYDAWCIENE
jgi:hypothetical protein